MHYRYVFHSHHHFKEKKMKKDVTENEVWMEYCYSGDIYLQFITNCF